VSIRLKYELVEDGIRICQATGILRRERPINTWAGTGEAALARALGRITPFIDEENDARLRSRRDGECLFLSHPLVAKLEDTDARALGLPPAAPFGLRIESLDHVKSPNFRVRVRWVQGGGVPVNIRTNGALLIHAGSQYRIPEPAFSLNEHAHRLTEELPEAERLIAYQQLGEMLKTHVDPAIKADDYLESVTVYHASAFSLKLGIHDDQFDFDPVLFGREIVEEAQEGTAIDEEASLLPPYYQDIFAKKWFRHFEDARPAYPLESGSFVVIDPSLRPSMRIVREVSSSRTDKETRRRFITNPTGFLHDVLDPEEALVVDQLFIETEQFSDRVTGIDIWRQPVLPWIKPAPETWLPEKYGIKVGDHEPVEARGEDLCKLQRAFALAEQQGRASFHWKDQNIPVSEQTRSAIEDLLTLDEAVNTATHQQEIEVPESDEMGSDGENGPPPILDQKRFLTIADNLEAIAYERYASAVQTMPKVPQIPEQSVCSQLKSYQILGFQWLVQGRLCGLPGVLLADDMGLGKTLQALAYLTWQRSKNSEPVLVVAPTGLLANWKAEIDKHLKPDALGQIVDAYGAALHALKPHPKASTETKVGQTNLNVDTWRDAGIVLTTYETMRDYHFSFGRIRFSTIIFDEIQKLKNPASQVSRAARALNAKYKIGMTGTPVENRLQDIWSIMDVLWPGFLGASKDFEAAYPIHDLAQLDALYQKIFQPAVNCPPAGLRRLKIDELDGLPEKHDISFEAEMPEAQAEAYRSVVVRAYATRKSLSPDDGMLKILQDFKRISLHPEPPDTGYGNMDAYILKSARLSQTINILDSIHASGEKALIFLESLEMQAFLASYIERQYSLAKPPARIHGGVSGSKRQALVDAFQSAPPGFDVMILSPKAGGVGLTITAANHVIHLSRWWNPAVEDQSTDRVFRIGQYKPVHVYYPMAVHPSAQIREHSFDLKLDGLLRRKRELAGRMLIPPDIRDRDTNDLFNDVVLDLDQSEATEMLGAPEGQTQTGDRHTTTEYRDAIMTRANHLTADATAPLAGPSAATATSIRLLRFEEGVEPDCVQLFEDLKGALIETMELIDPYTFWRQQGQAALARLIKTAISEAAGVRLVKLVTLPAGCLKNRHFHTEDRGLQHLRSAITATLAKDGGNMPQIRHQTRRRTRDRDFHDRSILVVWCRDGIRWRREYVVGRGLDAFIRPEFHLTIHIHPDEQLP